MFKDTYSVKFVHDLKDFRQGFYIYIYTYLTYCYRDYISTTNWK